MMAAEALAALAGDYWEFHLREHPATANELGDRRYRRELFRESAADYERRDRQAAAFLERLAAVPAGELREADLLTFHLLQRELGEGREHFAFRTHLRPMLFPLGPEGAVAYVNDKTTIFSPADADDLLARLETVPAFLDHHRERLQAGIAAGYRLPRVLLDRICRTVEGYLAAPVERSAWYKPLVAPASGDGVDWAPARAALRELIEHRIQPAHRHWLEWLRGDFASHCRDSVGLCDEPGGEAYYQFLARHHTTTRLSPAEIHAIGHQEVAELQADMEAVAAEAGHAGDLVGFRQYLNSDPRFVAASAAELRERVESVAKRIERRIPEFFGRLPRMTYGIESIPEGIAAQLPPAYAQPNPASGRTAGIFWVTSLPQRCPGFLHVPLTMHEAWPGHLMHVALVQEMSGLPAFRRYGMLGYTAYVEGWALYCERLGHDFGLLQDPCSRYGRLEMAMWRAARLVVDTGIHALGWTRAQAIDYMCDHLTLARATIEAEVDRYIGMPGQALAYMIGERKFRELRERARRALGGSLDLRALHDRMIDCGPVTLELLDAHVQAWINGERARAADRERAA